MTPDRVVLFASPYYPPHVGGVETYVHGLATALHALPGWRAVVVTTGGRGRVETDQDDKGPRVYRLPAICRVSYTPIDPRWSWQVRRILRRERPDFVNVHTPVPGLADMVTFASGDIPVVVTYHAAGLAKAGHPAFNVLAGAYSLVEDAMMHRATLILGVSDYVGDRLRHRYGAKVGVLENAVDETILRSCAPVADPEFGAAFMARLDPTHAWKGLDQLLLAARSHGDRFGEPLRVLVIGDGTARPHYQALARDLGIADSVTFAGRLSGAAKFDALLGASALVTCPTSANDAFPTVLLEAWASGVPVVATTIGPLASLVNDGVTGLLVPPRQPHALADALHRVRTTPRLRSTLIHNTTAKVRDSYTWARRVGQFAAMLEALTTSSRRGSARIFTNMSS